VSASLAELFPDAQPLRGTHLGLWLPTPIAMLFRAAEILADAGLLTSTARCLDAGCGDGRVLGVLWSLDPRLERFGIEHDRRLLRRARTRLRALGAGGTLAGGDYFEGKTYRRLGARLSDMDLVFNYPDGNETRLEQLVSGTQARLVLLGPDTELRFARLATRLVARVETAPRAPAWRLLVSEPGREP
jgi:SAM-dependent methyltransferase